MRIQGEEKEKGTEIILETLMTENFPKSVRHQTTDTNTGSSENTKQDKCQKQTNTQKQTKNPTSMHSISKLQKIKGKENILKRARGKIHLTYKGTKIKTIMITNCKN